MMNRNKLYQVEGEKDNFYMLLTRAFDGDPVTFKFSVDEDKNQLYVNRSGFDASEEAALIEVSLETRAYFTGVILNMHMHIWGTDLLNHGITLHELMCELCSE